MPLTLHAFSTALFSTWYLLEEAGILFDCGDGCAAHLLGRSRKAKHVFISHPDRDHLGGLLQFNQLNARGDHPIVYHPADSQSFPALREFSVRFDPQVKFPEWQPIRHGSEIAVGSDYLVRAIRNEHVAAPPDRHKSLSFLLFRRKQKLKAEFRQLAGSEIAALRAEGRIEVVETVLEPVLAYSADTPVAGDGRWDGFPILIHEATFFTPAEKAEKAPGRNEHSSLEEVIAMVAASNVRRLILGHFSSRYRAPEIEAAVAECAARHGLHIPIDLVLPGVYRVLQLPW